MTNNQVDDPATNNRQQAPPQLDFLTEIRQKLEKKNSQQQQQQNGDSSEQAETTGPYKPSNFLRKQSTASTTPNGTKSNHIDSPKAIKK